MYLALTASRIGLGDVMAAGLADQAMPAEAFRYGSGKGRDGETVMRALAGF